MTTSSGERALTPHDSRLPAHRRAVLFDFFDTLARVDIQHVLAARERSAHAAGIDVERFQGLWRENSHARVLGSCGALEDQIAAMLRSLDTEPSDALVLQLAEADRAAWIAAVRLYSDAVPTLEALRRRGLALGLVSNCSCQVGDVLRAHGLDHYFDALALSFELGAAKPDPPIYLAACEQLGVAPKEAVFVADGWGGELDAARSLGMLAVLVQHDDQNQRERTITSYDARIGSLAELLNVIAPRARR